MLQLASWSLLSTSMWILLTHSFSYTLSNLSFSFHTDQGGFFPAKKLLDLEIHMVFSSFLIKRICFLNFLISCSDSNHRHYHIKLYVALTVSFSAHFQCILNIPYICTLDLWTCWSLLEYLVSAHSQSSQSTSTLTIDLLASTSKHTMQSYLSHLYTCSNLPPCTSITMTFKRRSCSVPLPELTYLQ